MIQSPWHILIIDDNPEDRREMRQMLLLGSDRRYSFTEVGLGEDGLASIKRLRPNRFDCVLLDFSLPDMDAVQWLAHLTMDATSDLLPVVVITGGTLTDGRGLLRAGAQDFIGKSWSTPESLTRAVENAVDRSGLMIERVRVDRQLSASESKLSLGVTLAGLGLGEVDFHSDTIRLDEIASKIFDLPANVAIPRHLLHATFHPEDRSLLLERISESLQVGGNGFVALEHRIVKRDRSIAWVNVRTRIEFESHAVRKLRPVRALLAVLDVTQRKSASELLEKSEKRYRSLFSSIDEGFCLVKLLFDSSGQVSDYRFLEVNPSFSRQTGLNNVECKTIREVLPEVEEHWFNRYAKVSQTGEPLRLESFSKALGRWYEIFAFRIDDADHDQIAILFKDISARKLAQSELTTAILTAESASQAKSDFITNMSHELRTPLNAILGFAQLMQGGEPAPSTKQAQSLGHIVKAGWYLLALINETLDLAVIESGVAATWLEPVHLTQVIRDCDELMRPLAQERGIGINYDNVDVRCYAYADQTRVKQIFINLLSNAIKYSPRNCVVRVSCSLAKNGYVRLVVSDVGPGLSESETKLLFRPFQRLSQTAGAVSGTGIGLAMCKRLTDLMHGTIGVESTLGKGSSFWIELPEPERLAEKAELDAPLPNVIQLDDLTKVPGRGHSLLHIDDNPLNLVLIEELIAHRPNHRLMSASHHALGHELAQAHQPTVILMDVNLPGETGVESLKKLRENPLTAHIPVIALSSNARAQDIAQGISAGFLQYVAKPINADEFLRAIDLAFSLSSSAPP